MTSPDKAPRRGAPARGSDTRRAAILATLLAIPAALLAAILTLWLGSGGGPADRPAATPSAAPSASASVSAAARDLARADAATCRGLLARLPDTLRGLRQRPVSAGAEQNAAYGEPPIVLRCGVAQPDVAPAATVYSLSTVCWIPKKAKRATVWTTVDRKTPISVTVPAAYQQPGQWAAAFSRLVATTPEADTAPSGCHR